MASFLKTSDYVNFTTFTKTIVYNKLIFKFYFCITINPLQQMKQKVKALFFCIIVLTQLITSCAVHVGQITGNAALGGNNYRHVGTVSASNECIYVFYWGGNEKRAQIQELKENLEQRYPLRGGLAWANVTAGMKTGFYVIFDKRKATLTADIIDFWPDTNTANAAYNGYYYNDSIFIPVPIPIRNESIKKDSLEIKLLRLNAEKMKRITNPLVKVDIYSPLIDKEVIILRKQPTIGIIIRTHEYRVDVAYLSVDGKVKVIQLNYEKVYKY